MGETVKKIALGGAIIGAAFLTGGAALAPAFGGLAGAGAGIAAGALTTTALGSAALLAGGSMIALGAAQGIGLIKTPKIPAAQLSRLTATFDPNAPRKIVFGETAMGTDIVYYEPSGAEQETIDYIIAVAAHKVTSIDSIYSDDKLMWSASGGVQSGYTGYLTVATVLEGTSSNTVSINGGTRWGSSCRLTGCAYVHIQIKRTGIDKKAESPFVGGLPSRLTIVGKGLPVYDARFDSTNGGSGSMRPDDQTTWAFTVSGNNIGKNPFNQLYSFLLGWKIGGVISIGAGMPPARLDFADQITAANIADESVTYSGGTHKRYETSGMFDDNEAPSSVIQMLCVHGNAEPRDVSGKLGVRVAYNDLSGTLLELDEDDIFGPVQWESGPGVSETINVVLGGYTDEATAALFQMAPYTRRAFTSPDGIDRQFTLDLPMFQNPERATRVAEQVLQRSKWQGRLTATFGPRALAAQAGQPVRLTFAPRGFASKIFRIERQELRVVTDGESAAAFCPMTLVEESATIYTAPTTSALGSNVAAASFDPLNNPLAITAGDQIGVENGATRNGPGQLLPDVTFDPAIWTLTGGASRQPASYFGSGWPGDYGITIDCANTAVSNVISPTVDVAPGNTHFVGAHVAYAAATKALYINIAWYNSLGVQFANSTFVRTASGTAYDVVGDVPPAGAVKAAFYCYTLSGAGSGEWFIGAPYLGLSQPGADVTVDQPVVQYLDPGSGRPTRSRFMSTALLIGVANTVSAAATATDQGSGTGVTISIPAHVRKIANVSSAESVSYNAGSLTNRSYSATVHIYADDPDMAGGAVTYQSTISADDLLVNGRYHVTTITTPANGGTPTGGSGGGGSVRPLPPGENIP